MMSKRELANDPDVMALSKIDDSMLQLLSPLARTAVKVARKLIAENTGKN